MGDMDTHSNVRRGLDQIVPLLAAVTAADLDRPTPCSGWVVRDLVDHIVYSTAGMASMARGEQVDWSLPTPHAEDPVAEFSHNAAELLVAFDSAGDQSPTGMALAELAAHAWDLATALGRGSAELDPEVAEAGLAFVSTALTPEMRGNAFGPERPAPDGSNVYERLAAFAGREVSG